MDIQLCVVITKDGLNIAGVVFATAGSCLLWYFVGEVVTVNREEILEGKPVTQTIPATSPELICRLRLHKYMAKLGIFLTVVGGLLQLISACM